MWAGRRDDDHVAKPINVEEMFATLARWIRPGIVGPRKCPGLQATDRARIPRTGSPASQRRTVIGGLDTARFTSDS